MANDNPTISVLMTPFGDVHEKDMKPDEVSVLRSARLRKGQFDFDMRYKSSRKAQEVVDAIIACKEAEWLNGS